MSARPVDDPDPIHRGPGDLEAPPAAWLAELRSLLGADAVTEWCADLLAERVSPVDPHLPDLSWLGGSVADWEVRHIDKHGGPDYWPRLWGARGLLHVWSESTAVVVTPVVVAALDDEHWRVREMTAKVAAKWELAEAAEPLAGLLRDPVPRVRSAAVRALGVVGEGEHAEALSSARNDPEVAVRRAATKAIEVLATRLDRPDLLTATGRI